MLILSAPGHKHTFIIDNYINKLLNRINISISSRPLTASSIIKWVWPDGLINYLRIISRIGPTSPPSDVSCTNIEIQTLHIMLISGVKRVITAVCPDL